MLDSKKATYKVIRKFADKDGTFYKVGSVWPKSGTPAPERIEALKGDNAYKKVYIKEG